MSEHHRRPPPEDFDAQERDPGLLWFGLILTMLLGIVTGIALVRGMG